MITQSAINFISLEYEAIGVDIHKEQSNYVLKIGGIMLLIALLAMAVSILVGFLSARVSSSLGKICEKRSLEGLFPFPILNLTTFQPLL